MKRLAWMTTVCLALLLSGLANADQILPSDRVQTQLNVRERPDIGSPIVGTLQTNEMAELVGDIPYWYQIQLSDGIQGYVSKAWSERVATVTGEGRLIRLGAWNIKKLGHGSSKDYAAVVKVIEDNFDILAVVEVMQKAGAHGGYDTLMSTLGDQWEGIVTTTPRPNTTSGNAEFYAVIYRRGLIRPCAQWGELRYHSDNDGSTSGVGGDIFSREPAFGCFEAPLNTNAVGIDFLLAAYHARWSDGDKAAIAAEVSRLDDVFTSMSEARPGEKDLIIAGDFNLDTPLLQNALTYTIPTQGDGSTLNTKGEITNNQYDHLILHDSAATKELVGAVTVLDVRGMSASNDQFYKTVSDHLPVLGWLRANGPDDD